MTYDSLDKIPYKLFLKIDETGNVALLSDEETDVDILSEIWDQLYEEHLSKNQTSESKKVFKLSKTIDELLLLNKVILMSCSSLRFEFSQEAFDIITGYGYKLSIADNESYYYDLDKIEREAKAYIVKSEYYQGMLPEKKELEKGDYNIDDVMASYSMILGYNIGKHNEITYKEHYAHQKSVNNKIDSIKKQNNK